ncbi:GNAT family N-acetyltransferase, partial [Cribrihabitans sp. XS_ASV171]
NFRRLLYEARYEFILELVATCIRKADIWEAPQLGYILHPDTWGRGLAYKALCAILPRAFDHFAELPEMTASSASGGL